MQLILYSFKRCPYAMRARFGLALTKTSHNLREVNLKNKPEELLLVSPKGTVPVLIVDDRVIDESLEILAWLSIVSDFKFGSGLMFDLLDSLHQDFIPALNRFKYPDRYADLAAVEVYQGVLKNFLLLVEQRLAMVAVDDKVDLTEIAVYPFVRQVRIADADWLNRLNLRHLNQWLAYWDQFAENNNIMAKYPEWIELRQDVVVAY